MNRYRPASVLVLAIFNIILGSVCSLTSLFTCVNVAVPSLMSNKQSEEMIAQLEADIPGFVATNHALAIFSLVMSGFLLASGLGMLGMKPWARLLALVHGWLLLLSQLILVVYRLALVNPATARATTKAMEMEFEKMPKNAKAGKEMVEMMNNIMPGAMVFVTVLSALVVIGYATYELVTLMRRPTKDAFAGIVPPPRFSDAYDEPLDRPLPFSGPSSEGIKDFNNPHSPDNLP